MPDSVEPAVRHTPDTGEWRITDRALQRAMAVFSLVGIVVSVVTSWVSASYRLERKAEQSALDSLARAVALIQKQENEHDTEISRTLAVLEELQATQRVLLRARCLDMSPYERALAGLECGGLPYRPSTRAPLERASP